MIDNASSEAQVRPLLPGPGPHRVVVTSRHTLAGLGARLLEVGALDDDAAVALLDAAVRAARPNDDRVSADRQGAARLARICGELPLALQITAALLADDPTRTVSELADELADEVRRLEALQYDDGSGISAWSVGRGLDWSAGNREPENTGSSSQGTLDRACSRGRRPVANARSGAPVRAATV